MSTLWTPSGERPVPPRTEQSPPSAQTPPPAASSSEAGVSTGQEHDRSTSGSSTSGPSTSGPSSATRSPADEELAQKLGELRRELANTPAEAVVANHCYGLFELAALHLSSDPPRLDQAKVAIDAMGCLVEGMTSRLGDNETSLRQGLSQIRLAYVQIGKAGASETTASTGGTAP